MRIVLIGLSGTGKSTSGQELARLLGWEFVDTDSEVVARAGKPIHRIFEEEGEAAFRRLEAEAVSLAVSGERRVIALGGGAVMDPESRKLLSGSLVVHLEAEIETMLRRLTVDSGREPRPMLGQAEDKVQTDGGQDYLPSVARARMEQMRAVRSPIYRQLAGAVVSTEDVDARGAAARLEAVARGRLGNVLPAAPSQLSRISICAAAGGYDVVLGTGILDRAGELLRRAGLEGRVRIISDQAVYALHGERVERAVGAEGYQVTSYQVPVGESSKSLEVASRLYDWLVDSGTERRDLVMALGGGVAGDLAGFVAATFLRGLRMVQMPTSLLAQVDSSVGGKVAVNHPKGKNLIGAFYPPALVLADVGALATLPGRELSAALAEVVKHGVILDEAYFTRLEKDAAPLMNLDLATLIQVVGRSIELKAQVVEKDEREAGLRAILNYGHTIGHAVEALTGFERYRHGEAVAIGMTGAAELAVALGMMNRSEAVRQVALLKRFGLPTTIPGLALRDLLSAIGHDKKTSQGKVTWVLPETIGRVALRRDVRADLVSHTLLTLGATTCTAASGANLTEE